MPGPCYTQVHHQSSFFGTGCGCCYAVSRRERNVKGNSSTRDGEIHWKGLCHRTGLDSEQHTSSTFSSQSSLISKTQLYQHGYCEYYKNMYAKLLAFTCLSNLRFANIIFLLYHLCLRFLLISTIPKIYIYKLLLMSQ